jgi:hypothetical protein
MHKDRRDTCGTLGTLGTEDSTLGLEPFNDFKVILETNNPGLAGQD